MEKQQHLHNKGTVWKHGFNISNFRDGGNMNKKVSGIGVSCVYGPTPQLAACRAFVASVYGDSVFLSSDETT